MDIIKIDTSKISETVSGYSDEIESIGRDAVKANELLHSGKGAGSEFLGWVDLPSSTTVAELNEIEKAAGELRRKADVIIIVGIGGSYLGAKAVIEALGDSFGFLRGDSARPRVVFAGQNLSEDYMYDLLDAVRDLSIAVIVISKSGTTTEPAVAFRILKAEMESRYGKTEAASRIIAVTDREKGALKAIADREGYGTFTVPDDVGGRYSVLTPVGLLPIAAAGIDIRELVRGARDMEEATGMNIEFWKNPAAIYAATRNIIYRRGYKVEILAGYEPCLTYIAEWWKQLFGESEGKDGKGIFPASVSFTADLHSMGQYIQQGERILMETVVSVEKPHHTVTIENDADNLDGLNYLAGRRVGEINRMAELGVSIAHADGGCPNMRIAIPEISEYYLGALMYLFEKACGISGYMLGVNPFDQPGVEEYKKNVFALLGKPGHEAETEKIKKRHNKIIE